MSEDGKVVEQVRSCSPEVSYPDIDGKDGERLHYFYELGVPRGLVIDEARTKEFRSPMNERPIILKIDENVSMFEGPSRMDIEVFFRSGRCAHSLDFPPKHKAVYFGNEACELKSRLESEFGKEVLFCIVPEDPIIIHSSFFPVLCEDIERVTSGAIEPKILLYESIEAVVSNGILYGMKNQAYTLMTGIYDRH